VTIRGIPHVGVVLDESNMFRQRRPLRAAEMIDHVMDEMRTLFGQKVNPDRFPAQVMAMLREVIFEQARLRGLEPTGFTDFGVRVEMVDPGHASIVCNDGWLKNLDRDLRNRDCPRCGSLLALNHRHSPEECDVALVHDVIES